MKITFLVYGKTEDDYILKGLSIYENRLKHYVSFDAIVIPSLKNSKSIPIAEQKKKEGELILKNINPSDRLILLDEQGKEFSSATFSGFIQQQLNSGTKHVVFVVGGAYGFSEDVYKRGDAKIALSQMTFPHQMVRLFFTEQLYRAFTIIKNEKYHH